MGEVAIYDGSNIEYEFRNGLARKRVLAETSPDITLEVGALEAGAVWVPEVYTREEKMQIFVFLTALYSVPSHLYEAAHMEGANAWEQFWKITFPMVMPMVLVNVVYSIVDTFVTQSNQVMEYVYQLSFKNFNFSLSSAISWLYFIAVGLILALVFWLVNRRTFYYTD